VALADEAAGWVEVESLLAGRQIASGAPRVGQGGNDDDLMPAIDRVFARRGVRARAVGTVIVSVGPGGYTGLRIACAVGKMIAEAAGARCVAAPTAAVVAHRVDPSAWSRGGVAVALASKGESAWVQRVTTSGPITGGRILHALDLTELHNAGVRTLVADRFLPPSMRDGAAALGWTVIEPTFDPAACIEVWRAHAVPSIDPVELVPLYPREPDAVTLWREKAKGEKR
jgi:tRNA A37 threonylcarbamoyladenosine modification protein TsaB